MLQSSALSLTVSLRTIHLIALCFSLLFCGMDDDNGVCPLGFCVEAVRPRRQSTCRNSRCGRCSRRRSWHVINNLKLTLLFFVSRYLLNGEGEPQRIPKVLALEMLTPCAGRRAHKSLTTEQDGGPDGGGANSLGATEAGTMASPWVI